MPCMTYDLSVKVRPREFGKQVRGEKFEERRIRKREQGNRSQESGFRIQDSGIRIQESGNRNKESGYRKQEKMLPIP